LQELVVELVVHHSPVCSAAEEVGLNIQQLVKA
jgi:hypothetical protein